MENDSIENPKNKNSDNVNIPNIDHIMTGQNLIEQEGEWEWKEEGPTWQ